LLQGVLDFDENVPIRAKDIKNYGGAIDPHRLVQCQKLFVSASESFKYALAIGRKGSMPWVNRPREFCYPNEKTQNGK
jgi:hypothetical protein